VEINEIGVNVGPGAKIILQNALFRRIVHLGETPKFVQQRGKSAKLAPYLIWKYEHVEIQEVRW
jgi:hypothetical protein